MCGARHRACLDASRPWRRQRLPDRSSVWPRPWCEGDRRWLPVHVRPDRRFRSQGDASRLHTRWNCSERRPAPRRCVMTKYEYKVVDTGKHVEKQLNDLGEQGWRVVGVTTKKQLFIAPPQAIILMREVVGIAK